MSIIQKLKNAGNEGGDSGIRQNTSQTVAFLQARNQRFQAFLQQKITDLESKVTPEEAEFVAPLEIASADVEAQEQRESEPDLAPVVQVETDASLLTGTWLESSSSATPEPTRDVEVETESSVKPVSPPPLASDWQTLMGLAEGEEALSQAESETDIAGAVGLLTEGENEDWLTEEQPWEVETGQEGQVEDWS